MIVATRKPIVFLSYAAVDQARAMTLSDALRQAGIRVNGGHTLKAGVNPSRALRRQLLEADAVVAVNLSDAEGAPSVAFEIGAALAAEKPVFAVVSDAVPRVAPMFADARVFTLSHADQLIRQVQAIANAAAAS